MQSDLDKNWQYPGSMAEAKRNAILAALAVANGRCSDAAKILRIGRSTLYRLMQEFEIEGDLLQFAQQPEPQLSLDAAPDARENRNAPGKLIIAHGKVFMTLPGDV